MKKITTCILSGVLWFLVPNMLVLAKEISLTLEESTQRALDYNLDASRELYTLKKLEFARNTSWGAVIPNITLSTSISRRNRVSSNDSFGAPPQERWSMSGNMSLSTFLGPLLAQNIIKMIAPYYEYDIGDLTYKKAIYGISLKVQKSYFDILLAQSKIELYKRQLEVAKRQNQDADAAYKSGVMKEHDYLQTRIALLQKDAQVRSQKSKIVDMHQKFAILLGYDINTTFILTEHIPEISESEAQAIMANHTIDDNHDLKIQEIRTKAFKLNRINAWFGIMPTFSLRWNMASMFTKDITKDSITDFNNNWSDDTGSLGLTVSLSISNLIPGSGVMNAIVNSGYDLKIQQTNRQRTIESTKQQMVFLKTTLADILVNLDIVSERRTLAKRAYELMQVRYDNGLSPFTEYINTEKEFINVEQEYLSKKVALIKTMLEIQFLSGDE